MDVNFYFTSADNFFYEFVKTILFSVIASFIFWYFEIYKPRIKLSEISKSLIIERYTATKIQIIDNLLGKLGKDCLNKVQSSRVFDYKFLQNNVISSDDIYILRNKIDNEELISVAKSNAYYLNQLKTILLLELSQEYIAQHKKCKISIMSLIFFIDQYSNNLLEEPEDYHKIFNNEMHDIVLGMSTTGSYDVDQLPVYVEEAYLECFNSSKIKNLTNKIKVFFSRSSNG
jgi:hypothetical protein